MNLKKYTKAELISKIKELNPGNNDSNSTIFSKIINFILLFKSFILKITLITLIIKLFKRFSILRRIWTIFNLILVAIFGLSLNDIFEIDLFTRIFLNLSEFFSNSINFIRSSRFYTNILALFGRKIEVPIEFNLENKFPYLIFKYKKIDINI
jgi:hypothetical protein